MAHNRNLLKIRKPIDLEELESNVSVVNDIETKTNEGFDKYHFVRYRSDSRIFRAGTPPSLPTPLGTGVGRDGGGRVG
jgi:hypothetical protein